MIAEKGTKTPFGNKLVIYNEHRRRRALGHAGWKLGVWRETEPWPLLVHVPGYLCTV